MPVQFKIALNATPAATQANARKPQYVSPATQSVAVIATQGGAQVGTGVGNCTAAACTVALNVPIGSTTFAVTAFSGTGGSGGALSTGSVVYTVEANSVNAFSVTLFGIPASVKLLPQPAWAAYTQGQFKLRVQAYDASGNQIIAPGAFASPIVVTLTGQNGLRVTPATLTVTDPSSPLSVTIATGGATSAPAVIVAPSGLPGTPVTMQIVVITTPSPGATDETGAVTDSYTDLAAVPVARAVATAPLPPSVLLYGFSGINQGGQSSCAAAAFAEIWTYLVGVQRGWPPAGTMQTPPPANTQPYIFSPAFIYNAANDYVTDAGSSPLQLGYFVAANGIATWQDMPYTINVSSSPPPSPLPWTQTPSPQAIAGALANRLVTVESVDPTDIQTINRSSRKVIRSSSSPTSTRRCKPCPRRTCGRARSPTPATKADTRWC